MARKKMMIGWREWVGLPDLNINKIKVKVDTGAKTSALHAYFVEPYQKDGRLWVKFGIHPIQDCVDTEVVCHALVVDQREVTDSGGHVEKRYVIQTKLSMGPETFNTEITLTNRDTMKFRMLLGRNSLNNRCTVNPVRSYLLGRFKYKNSDFKQEVDNEDLDNEE